MPTKWIFLIDVNILPFFYLELIPKILSQRREDRKDY
jgi:hypothetical protein